MRLLQQNRKMISCIALLPDNKNARMPLHGRKQRNVWDDNMNVLLFSSLVVCSPKKE
jgi:hypothetical protein